MLPDPSPRGTESVSVGAIAVGAQLLLALVLTAFLMVAAHGEGDAVPRPLAILALYAAVAIVGAIGVVGPRRSLLLACAIVLVPGSVLSFSGVTLVFVVPMVLFAAAARSMPAPRARRAVEVAEIVLTVGLFLGAALALFTFTADTCGSGFSGTASCGTGLLTVAGVAAEIALLAIAVTFATWRAGLLARLVRRAAP